MYLKSLYPPLPPIPDRNHHFAMSGSPVPEGRDYVLHIDGLTGRQRTRNEFNELVLDGATALATPVSRGGLGLSGETGDIIGIYGFNCLDYVALIHSSIAIATPFVLISPYSTPFELSHSLKTVRPTRMFVQPELLSGALAVASEIGLSSENVHILEGRAPERQSFADMIESVRSENVPRVPIKPATKETIAYFVFSSGTSGLPKAIMVSHGNLWATIYSFIVMLQENAKHTKRTPPAKPPVILAALPFHHSYGLHILTLRGFLIPMTYVVLPKWHNQTVLHAISRFRVSVVSMVPSGLHSLIHSGLLEQTDLSSVEQVLCGAAHTPPELIERLKVYVPGVTEFASGYGLSEATLSGCMKPPPGLYGIDPVPNTCGILLPGMQARIIRDDGSEADVDEPGELLLRGPNIVLGYYGNEKATKETFVSGWLHTGDRLKSDGSSLFFVDRVKDTLKISGAQVSPTEIEEVIRLHPGKLITDVSVVGVSGGRTSDEKVPRAFIVLSDKGKALGVEATMKTLKLWVEKNLSRYKWLRGGIEVVNEIPKLPTGKVLRRVLQDRYEHHSRLGTYSQPKL